MEKGNSSKIVYGIIPIFLLTILAVGFISFNQPTPSPFISSDSDVSTIQYKGYVCTYSTGDFEGRTTPAHQGINELVKCDHNLLTNEGANAIRSILGAQVSYGNFTAIGLCNATEACIEASATATGATFENEFTDCGLERTYGTYGALGQTGNWSVAATFTASCDGLETNKTGLFNQTEATSGTLLAENTFTKVSLNSPDTLTVNWTITTQDGG